MPSFESYFQMYYIYYYNICIFSNINDCRQTKLMIKVIVIIEKERERDSGSASLLFSHDRDTE